MKNAILFTEKQKELILKSLEIYSEFPFCPLKPELKSALIFSSIQKLKNLSIFTSFSKQELTIMYMSLDHIEDYPSEIKDFSEQEFYSLTEKIYKLAN